MKPINLFLALLMFTAALFAQQNSIDVVYLKNGSSPFFCPG